MSAPFRALAALIILCVPALVPGPARASYPIPRHGTTRSHRHRAASAPAATPTLSPVPSFTATAVWTNTATATPTAVPTFTSTPSATASDTATATTVPTDSPTALPTATATPNSPSRSDPTGFDVTGVPPAQTLPSAVLVYPLIQTSPTQDTRIELLNLTSASVSVQCFFVSDTCNELDFFLSLTANQPLSWMASTGTNGNGARVAPPFVGEGELKCVVLPQTADLTAHNALQGRALISDTSGQVVGYSAIAFRRLLAGDFTGFVALDGVTYEACPDRLHFHALASQSSSDSELVLVPCTEDLENQIPASTTLQFAVINEFEQQLSGAAQLSCFYHRAFSSVAALRRSSIGTDTAHVIVRGVAVPVIGLVIERFSVPGTGALSTSANEPTLEGSRAASLNLPPE